MDNRCLAAPQYGCSVAELYHHERNHQGLGNRLILRTEPCTEGVGAIERRQRLGGMLNDYYRQAA
jgi:putative transposase